MHVRRQFSYQLHCSFVRFSGQYEPGQMVVLALTFSCQRPAIEAIVASDMCNYMAAQCWTEGDRLTLYWGTHLFCSKYQRVQCQHKNCTKPLCTKHSSVNLMTYRNVMLIVATCSTNKHLLRLTMNKIRTRIIPERHQQYRNVHFNMLWSNWCYHHHMGMRCRVLQILFRRVPVEIPAVGARGNRSLENYMSMTFLSCTTDKRRSQ